MADTRNKYLQRTMDVAHRHVSCCGDDAQPTPCHAHACSLQADTTLVSPLQLLWAIGTHPSLLGNIVVSIGIWYSPPPPPLPSLKVGSTNVPITLLVPEESTIENLQAQGSAQCNRSTEQRAAVSSCCNGDTVTVCVHRAGGDVHNGVGKRLHCR